MLILLALSALSASSAAPPPPAPCRAESIEVRTDAGDGDFSGMSHGGTSLILRNKGTSACLLPGVPTLAFLDGDGKTLPVERKAPPRMHPGPMLVPVRLDPGAQASTPLRWVSGEVYEHSRCFSLARVRVTFGASAMVDGAIQGRVCAASDTIAGVDQPALTLAKPGPSSASN